MRHRENAEIALLLVLACRLKCPEAAAWRPRQLPALLDRKQFQPYRRRRRKHESLGSVTCKTGHSQKDRGASLPARFIFLLIAAFAILHLPLGHSEPLRPSQHSSDWPARRIRTTDLPVHYSVQEHGRGRIAIVQEVRKLQKDQAPGDTQKSVVSPHPGMLLQRSAGIPGSSAEPDVIPPPLPAHFSARAPPLLA